MHTVGGLQNYYNCLDWFYNHILFSFPVPIELEQEKSTTKLQKWKVDKKLEIKK